jgi:hypothetical protein
MAEGGHFPARVDRPASGARLQGSELGARRKALSLRLRPWPRGPSAAGRLRHQSRHGAGVVAVQCGRPAATPPRSAAQRFWLVFHSPSMRSTSISMPMMARSLCAMQASGASPTAQACARGISCVSVNRSTSARSHAASSLTRSRPCRCTTA